MTDDRHALAARAGRLAREHYATGANCAESVLYAVPEALGDESLRLPESIGTGWTAGIGEGGCLCGALAASVLLVGAQTEGQPGAPAAKRARSVEAADQLRAGFKDTFGSTCCRVLRRGMTPASPECRAHCADITARTAELVTEQLLERAEAPVPLTRRVAARDVANTALPALGLAAVAVAGFTAAVLLTGGAVTAATAGGFTIVAVLAAFAWMVWRMSGRSGSK